MEGPSLLESEIPEGLNSMKNGKAEGCDGIPAELLKNMGNEAIKRLIGICKGIYETGDWPEDFRKTIMI